MKAAVVEGPGKLAVKDVPEPEPGDYDALCENLYGGICTGTDLHLVAADMHMKPNYPSILGHESIGRVVKIGRKVRSYRVGDLVTRVGTPPVGEYNVNWGGFAELGIAKDHRAMREDGVDPSEWLKSRVNQVLPEGFDPRESVMVITWRETLSYITRIAVRPASAVLVIGSGANGLSFANHAANLDAKDVVVVGSPGREEAARAVGASAYFSYKNPDHVSTLAERYADGFAVIIDAVGKQSGMETYLPLIEAEGTFGIYGLDELRKVRVNPVDARKTFRFYNGRYDEEETHEAVVDLMEKGRLVPGHYLSADATYALDDINDAFEAVRNREAVKPAIRIKGEA